MNIKVSIGEIVDKLSILNIKKNNITEESKLFNIITEYNYLYDVVFNQLKIESDDFNNLLLVNESLWKIEDDIRDKERDKVFDIEFIELARSVYTTNDKRAEIKKEINLKYGSFFVEEKSYSNYC
jgi:predicted transposase YbfD/YdcC